MRLVKCKNESCERKLNCFRYTAITADHYQYYADYKDEHCPYFWDNKQNIKTL